MQLAQEKRDGYLRKRQAQLEEYRKQQAEEEAKLRALQEQEQALREVEEEKRRRHNAERVAHRTEEFAKKREEMDRRVWALQEEMFQREQRLEALREKVRVCATADAGRTTGHTKSSRNRDDVEAAPAQWSHGHGYDNQRLFKDGRFRLQEALATAGLMNTDYARQMIGGARPAQAPRPGLQSNIFGT